MLQLLLKSEEGIPFFLPAASLWTLFKIVWLQSESSSLWSAFRSWFLLYSQRAETLNATPLPSSYHTLSTLLSVIREDLDTTFDCLLRGAYHENRKTIAGPTFNLDSAISSEPQIRVISGVVDLVACDPHLEDSLLHWLVSRLCSLWKSPCLMVRTYCLLWLRRLQGKRLGHWSHQDTQLENCSHQDTQPQHWIHQEIASIVTSSQLVAAIQHELQWFPLFSLPTKALLELVGSSPLDPPCQSTFLRLPPHQRIHLGNRPIQPPWTLECWVKIPDSVESPTVLSILSSPIASVDILCGMRRNRVQLLVDGDAVTLDCDVPANQWSHIAIVMDAQVTVRFP